MITARLLVLLLSGFWSWSCLAGSLHEAELQQDTYSEAMDELILQLLSDLRFNHLFIEHERVQINLSAADIAALLQHVDDLVHFDSIKALARNSLEPALAELAPRLSGARAMAFASGSCVVENVSWSLPARRNAWLMPLPSP